MSDEHQNSPPDQARTTPDKTPATAQAFDVWAETHATPDWLLAAARHKANWPEGRELSEAEYLKALEDAQSEVVQ